MLPAVGAFLPSVAQAVPLPSTLLLSSFDGSPESGSAHEARTWAGNVLQGAGFITVGGSAGSDNGWISQTQLGLDATGMRFLNITAQREAGNAASRLFLQFEDAYVNTFVLSIDTAAFAFGEATEASIAIDSWGDDGFDFTQIGSWSLGGGGVGTEAFRMSFFNLEFSRDPVAVPEPAETVGASGLAALAVAGWYRRRRGKRSAAVQTRESSAS